MQFIGMKFGKKSFEERVETAVSNLSQKMNSWDSSSISQPSTSHPATDTMNHQRIESIMESESIQEDIKITAAVNEALSRIKKERGKKLALPELSLRIQANPTNT